MPSTCTEKSTVTLCPAFKLNFISSSLLTITILKRTDDIDKQPSAEQAEGKAATNYNHVMKSTGMLGGVQAFYIAMSIVRNKLTAILIGSAGMGLADLYCRTLELLGNTTNFGIAFSAVRRLSSLYEGNDHRETAHYVRLIRTWTFITAIFGALVCLALSPLISLLTTNSYDHTLTYCLLAPAVSFTTLAGGEIAILKGMRRLKHLALVSAAGALGTVLITVPLYAAFGLNGILPVIIGTTALTFLLNLRAATRMFPYRISPLRLHFVRQGGMMLRLGAAYIAAGIVGSSAELLVRTIIVDSESGYNMVGLYAAGLTLTVSYARLIFVAMDADYFPRISAAVEDKERMNNTINQQIDILVLLMAPFLILFAIGLPIIVPILYTREFLAVVPMVLCALPYMFFKAIYSPIAYLPLAAGKSQLYLFAEFMYYVVFSLFVTLGYTYGGLVGAGLGLSAANLCDLIFLPLIYSHVFGFRFNAKTSRRCLAQGALLILAMTGCALPYLWAKWGTLLIFALSVWISWHFLQHETAVISKIQRLLGRFRKK